LAIKPSFEEDVVSLLDKGHLGALSAVSRFKVAVDPVRATEQNYENRRAEATAPSEAGVEPEDLAASSGNLIGSGSIGLRPRPSIWMFS